MVLLFTECFSFFFAVRVFPFLRILLFVPGKLSHNNLYAELTFGYFFPFSPSGNSVNTLIE